MILYFFVVFSYWLLELHSFHTLTLVFCCSMFYSIKAFDGRYLAHFIAFCRTRPHCKIHWMLKLKIASGIRNVSQHYGAMAIKSPQTYCAGSSLDIHCVVNFLKVKRFHSLSLLLLFRANTSTNTSANAAR